MIFVMEEKRDGRVKPAIEYPVCQRVSHVSKVLDGTLKFRAVKLYLP